MLFSLPLEALATRFFSRGHLLIHALGIRNFIVGLTIKLASDETIVRRERAYLGKLNLILVQVCGYPLLKLNVNLAVLLQ